jgi:hypothetical protein
MFHIRHIRVADTRALRAYGVCRGPGGPLGGVRESHAGVES